MKHRDKKNTEEKIREWLELCDVAFELFKRGLGNKYRNEKLLWNRLNKKIQNDMILKRQVFIRIVKK